MRQFNDYASKVNDNLVKLAIIDVILLVASVAIAFYYFKIAGKKDKNSPAKLIFIDYIPLLLQLGIVGGSGFGFVTLLISAFEEYDDITLLLAIFAGTCFVCWVLLFELCCSISRWSKSDICFYIGSVLRFTIFLNSYLKYQSNSLKNATNSIKSFSAHLSFTLISQRHL